MGFLYILVVILLVVIAYLVVAKYGASGGFESGVFQDIDVLQVYEYNGIQHEYIVESLQNISSSRLHKIYAYLLCSINGGQLSEAELSRNPDNKTRNITKGIHIAVSKAYEENAHMKDMDRNFDKKSTEYVTEHDAGMVSKGIYIKSKEGIICSWLYTGDKFVQQIGP